MMVEGNYSEETHANEVVEDSINKASSKEETNVNVVSKMDLEVTKRDEPEKTEVVLEEVKKEEKPETNVNVVSKIDLEVTKRDEPEKREVVLEEVKKEEEPVVSEMNLEVTKRDKPEKVEVVLEKVEKEEEPNKREVVVEEKKKELESTIQEVVEEGKKGDVKEEEKEKDVEKREVVEEGKKGEQKKDVKEEEKEKDVENFEKREVVEEGKKEEEQMCRDVEEERKVLEEPQTREVEKNVRVEKPKIEEMVEERKIKEEEPSETNAVVEKKKDQEEAKAREQQETREVQEEMKKQDLESDTSLLEQSISFKEVNKFGSDLKEHEKKALNELRTKIEEAILENKFVIKKNDAVEKVKEHIENTKLAPEPIEEAKVKSISEEEKTTIEVANEENETTTEADKKDEEKHIKEEEKGKEVQEEKNEVEKQKEKCSPNGENDKKSDSVSVEEKSVEIVSADRDISLWGVPLLPSKGSEETNVILLKFLRARDFKVNEAFEMLRNTIQWRKEFKIDSTLDEELGLDLSLVAYMDGLDREGHPICYNMYGIFEDNELYQKTFGTEEKRQQFLRWRFQLMEKGIQKLDFSSGGVSSLLQINDLKNSPGPSKKELRMAMKQAVALLQDNYPEFVARNIFVNVPFWYYAFNAVLSPFLTQRTKSKFVFARPSKVTETLLRYIPAEQVPIRYGGLKRENDSEFLTDEESVVTELAIKAGSTETIEIPAHEVGTTIVWDITVLGWEVNYKAEFVPNDEGSYTIIVQKIKKMGFHEEPIRNSYKSNEPGKIILSIENGTYKKKRLFYRFKTHN